MIKVSFKKKGYSLSDGYRLSIELYDNNIMSIMEEQEVDNFNTTEWTRGDALFFPVNEIDELINALQKFKKLLVLK